MSSLPHTYMRPAAPAPPALQLVGLKLWDCVSMPSVGSGAGATAGLHTGDERRTWDALIHRWGGRVLARS